MKNQEEDKLHNKMVDICNEFEMEGYVVALTDKCVKDYTIYVEYEDGSKSTLIKNTK